MKTPREDILSIFPVHGLFGSLSLTNSSDMAKTPRMEGVNLK